MPNYKVALAVALMAMACALGPAAEAAVSKHGDMSIVSGWCSPELPSLNCCGSTTIGVVNISPWPDCLVPLWIMKPCRDRMIFRPNRFCSILA